MSTSTGVKNLRAMFENRTASYDQSTSPPSRGRSPSGSVSSVQSRPVSKVRASFVAVERPGEVAQSSVWGLRKTSDVSNMAEVQEEVIMDEQGAAQAEQNAKNLKDGQDLGCIMKGSSFGSAIPHDQSQSDAQPISKTPSSPVKTIGDSKNVATLVSKMQSPTKTKNIATQQNKSVKAAPPTIATYHTASKPKESPTLQKKSPTLLKKSREPSSPATSHTNMIKPRGGVSKIQGVIASANKAKAERAKIEESRLLSDDQNSSVKATATPEPKDVVQKSTQSEEEPEKEGTIPKKISTKPAVSKTTTKPATTRRSLLPEPATKKPVTERRSLAPQAPRVANITTKASLAKKASRASLAPTEEGSKSRQSTTFKPADESFLARLTRPTASSAQKAHGKIETTSPPRQKQVSAIQMKKSGRKSISTVQQNGEDSVHDTTNAVQDDNMSLGEPGPAEETEPHQIAA